MWKDVLVQGGYTVVEDETVSGIAVDLDKVYIHPEACTNDATLAMFKVLIGLDESTNFVQLMTERITNFWNQQIQLLARGYATNVDEILLQRLATKQVPTIVQQHWKEYKTERILQGYVVQVDEYTIYIAVQNGRWSLVDNAGQKSKMTKQLLEKAANNMDLDSVSICVDEAGPYNLRTGIARVDPNGTIVLSSPIHYPNLYSFGIGKPMNVHMLDTSKYANSMRYYFGITVYDLEKVKHVIKPINTVFFGYCSEPEVSCPVTGVKMNKQREWLPYTVAEKSSSQLSDPQQKQKVIQYLMELFEKGKSGHRMIDNAFEPVYQKGNLYVVANKETSKSFAACMFRKTSDDLELVGTMVVTQIFGSHIFCPTQPSSDELQVMQRLVLTEKMCLQ